MRLKKKNNDQYCLEVVLIIDYVFKNSKLIVITVSRKIEQVYEGEKITFEIQAKIQ